MYKILKKFIVPVVGLSMFLLVSNNTYAARFFLAPASTDLSANCDSAINIMIDTQGGASTAADAIIDFNPAEIEIVDQNLNVPGIQIRSGTVYEFYPGNKAESGRIYLTGASIMSSYTTGGAPDIYGSIILKNKPGVSSSSLNFYYIAGSTIDSNISDPSGVVDLLTQVSGSTFTFTDRGFCGNDTIAPVVSNVVPVPNSQGNPLNSKITFDLSDNLSGVNLSSVRVNIDGVDYVSGGAGFLSPGDKMKYSIEIDPLTDFLEDTQVVVTVFAQDNAGNVMTPPYRFTFNAPILDTVPPYVTNRVPAPGASGVDLDSNVNFRIKDDLSGVDISTIVVNIAGKNYKYGDGSVLITGSPAEYLVTIDPDEDFVANVRVDVKIDAEDLKDNPMTVSYSFNQPVSDLQPPFVQNENPKNGARKVALDSNVSFNIRDLLSGVDLASVAVTIEGVLYKEADFLTVSGGKNEYFIEIDPVSDFAEGKEITVSIMASDLFGNSMSSAFVFKFNKPAVCGDKILEEEFGEQCEPPNSPGCDVDCKFLACTISEEAVCGNLILETGEECERPGVGSCGFDCKFLFTPIEEVYEEVITPEEKINLLGGFLGLNTEEQKIIREMVKDSDGDGLPDHIEKLYGTNIYSADSDGDGISDREELLDYGTDPNVFDAEFLMDLRIVHPENKAKTGAGRLFVRGVGDPLRNVTIIANSLTGQKFDLGSTVATDNGKFVLASEVSLDPGEYLLTAENYNDDGSVFDTSDSVEILIDPLLTIPVPKVRSINDVVVKLGEIPRIDDPQPMVAGNSEPGAQIVSIFESSIFSSTIISDAASGLFTVFAPRPLELGMHRVTVYAVSPDGIVSEANMVNFEVIEKLSVFEKYPWWIWIVIVVFLATIGVLLYLLYLKKIKKEDIDYMKKLVAPVFEQKVEDQIKKELGAKSDKSENLFDR